MENKPKIGKRLFALFMGWLGAGVFWIGFTSIGWTNGNNILETIISLAVVIFVWVKIYKYYILKNGLKQS